MKAFAVTILLALQTSAAICRTPCPDTARVPPAADTGSTLVKNSKLRTLIGDRERSKICLQASAAKDSVITGQDSQIANQSEQLTVMSKRDSLAGVMLHIKDIQLDNMQRQRDDSEAYLAQAEKQLRAQKWRTWEVAGVGISVTGFLSYLLIKK